MPKKVTVQYRQLSVAKLGEGVDLKSMIVDVLRRRRWDTNAKHRVLSLDQDGSVVILNKVSEPPTWNSAIFAGQLIHLQEGSEVQAVLQSLDEDATEFVVSKLDVGARTRVLKGALYFAIVGNHVGLIEGQQVRGLTLERYLTALLQKAGELEPEQLIALDSKFLTGNGKELPASTELNVSAASNKADQTRVAVTRQESRVSEHEAAVAHEHEQATVFEVLRMLGWDENALESLGEEIPPDGWVEGIFRIIVKRRRKRQPISRATINHALRNIDPADLGLKGDGTEKGGIVKLSTQRDVETVGTGSLINPTSAMEQIVNALREWALAGRIDCRFDAPT